MESSRVTYLALQELVRRYELERSGTVSEHEPLTRFEHRVFSQNGEYGVLAELLQRIGIASRWLVEFGAQTGAVGNCVFLADVLGWSRLLLEAHADSANELVRKYAANPRVRGTRSGPPDNADEHNPLFTGRRVPHYC